MKVGDLVQVTHPNGSGCGDHLVPRGTLGVITRLFGDRFHKGPGYEEIEVAAASVGIVHPFYMAGWSVVEPVTQ